MRLPRRHSRRRAARIGGLTINQIIPSLITAAALCAGLTGIRFAIEAQWEFAVLSILLAAFLDSLDGRMARLLKTSSDFGASLDSLSDAIAFGVAPALILYFWQLQNLEGIGWAAALFFTVCIALRLARFNSSLTRMPAYAYNYFQGVPAPAAAALALLPLLLSFLFPLSGSALLPMVTAFWLVLVGVLAVSSLPTFSFKKMKIPRKWRLPFLALCALVIALLLGRPWATLVALQATYMLTFPFSWRRYQMLKQEAAWIQHPGKTESLADGPAAAGAPPGSRPLPAAAEDAG